MKQQVYFEDLGILDYKTAWDYQEKLLQENLAVKSIGNRQSAIGNPKSPDNEHTPLGDGGNAVNSPQSTVNHLLFVEHPPVYTLGKSGNIDHVLINEEKRSMKGIEFFRTNRGGDITFHGPQ
ncbi:MAG TPA: hypothetical protein VLJ68_04635, partial [Chitinophagaceae bacterium]|nr:hypothetical protein [Chitinophagaceae bacterium]